MSKAEDALAALEGPKQRLEHAQVAHATLKGLQTPHPKMEALKAELLKESEVHLKAMHGEHHAHTQKHGDKLQRLIDQAAQEVLDETGQVHSDHPDYVAPPEVEAPDGEKADA